MPSIEQDAGPREPVRLSPCSLAPSPSPSSQSSTSISIAVSISIASPSASPSSLALPSAQYMTAMVSSIIFFLFTESCINIIPHLTDQKIKAEREITYARPHSWQEVEAESEARACALTPSLIGRNRVCLSALSPTIHRHQ